MGRKRHVLYLLKSMRLQEGKAGLSDGGNGGVIGIWKGLERDVKNDRVLCEFVEVGNGIEENRGWHCDRGNLARSDGLKNGE